MDKKLIQVNAFEMSFADKDSKIVKTIIIAKTFEEALKSIKSEYGSKDLLEIKKIDTTIYLRHQNGIDALTGSYVRNFLQEIVF